MPSEVTLFLAGDAMITEPWSHVRDPGFDRLLAEMRTADASLVNLETVIHEFNGHAQADSGGTYLSSPPAIAGELKWAGVDLRGPRQQPRVRLRLDRNSRDAGERRGGGSRAGRIGTGPPAGPRAALSRLRRRAPSRSCRWRPRSSPTARRRARAPTCTGARASIRSRSPARRWSRSRRGSPACCAGSHGCAESRRSDWRSAASASSAAASGSARRPARLAAAHDRRAMQPPTWPPSRKGPGTPTSRSPRSTRTCREAG